MSVITYAKEQPDLESSTDDYARRFAGSVGRYFLEVQWRTVRDMLPPAENCRVLDIGGGHAQLAAPLVASGYDVTVFGSDDSCRDRLDREVGSNNYQLVTGDLLDLPLDTGSFDVVLAFRLLPHLSNWQRCIAETCRVAKRCVILDYPDLRSVNWVSNQLFAVKKLVEHNTRTYQCFRRSEIITQLRSNQFHQVDIRGQFSFPMALHRLVRIAALSRLTERIAKTCGLTQLLGSPIIMMATVA